MATRYPVQPSPKRIRQRAESIIQDAMPLGIRLKRLKFTRLQATLFLAAMTPLERMTARDAHEAFERGELYMHGVQLVIKEPAA
jgi:hypothetical protein